MAKGLWRFLQGASKYLVIRRDGTVPQWPYLLLGARDPAGADTLRYYARRCRELGTGEQYALDIERLALEFERYREDAGPSRPGDDEPRAASRAAHAARIIDDLLYGRKASLQEALDLYRPLGSAAARRRAALAAGL